MYKPCPLRCIGAGSLESLSRLFGSVRGGFTLNYLMKKENVEMVSPPSGKWGA